MGRTARHGWCRRECFPGSLRNGPGRVAQLFPAIVSEAALDKDEPAIPRASVRQSDLEAAVGGYRFRQDSMRRSASWMFSRLFA